MTKHMGPLFDDNLEVGDGGSSSSSSQPDWDSDSEPFLCREPTSAEEEEGWSAKRRRVAGAKENDSSRLRHSRSAAQRAAASEATLIIFDWDDTLMPSTWLQEQGLEIAEGTALPNDEQKAVLKKVENCVIRTLHSAKQLGQVIIVTNSERGWVELSCSKFLPEVAPVLEGMKILSARSIFEHTQPESPVHWKRLAFRTEIAAFSQLTAACAITKNIISVGDSMQERVALLEATEGRDCLTKSLKFEERPSPEQLRKELKQLCICLQPFVDLDESLDLCLQIPS